MEIKIGKHYVNKTWRFLVPCLRGHGTTFVNKFNLISKLAAGIHDTYLDGSTISNGRNVYFLVDKLYKQKEYVKFMEYIKYQDYFKGDYCPDSNIISSRKHMIVLELPKHFNNAYDKFLQSKYSEMYTETDLKALYSAVLHSNNLTEVQKSRKIDYEILSRTGTEALKIFSKKLDEEFGTEKGIKYLEKSKLEYEWELPLKKQEEIFNYPNGKGVFFVEELDKVWR